LNRLAGGILVAALAIPCGCAPGPAQHPIGESPVSAVPRQDVGPICYREDEVDIRARPVNPIRPPYPPRLRALGLEGDVEARVIVLSDGSVGGGRLVASTHDDFAAAVRTTLLETRFHPALRHGEPVSSWVTVRLHFRIEN
jgi:TonB family protein